MSRVPRERAVLAEGWMDIRTVGQVPPNITPASPSSRLIHVYCVLNMLNQIKTTIFRSIKRTISCLIPVPDYFPFQIIMCSIKMGWLKLNMFNSPRRIKSQTFLSLLEWSCLLNIFYLAFIHNRGIESYFQLGEALHQGNVEKKEGKPKKRRKERKKKGKGGRRKRR